MGGALLPPPRPIGAAAAERGAGQYDPAVVHLRIVVPAHQAVHAIDLLEGTPSACNIVHLAAVAKHPEGDLILCDVARSVTSVVVADLRELNIDVEGSISIQEIEGQLSTTAATAEAAVKRKGSDPIIWEEVSARTQENVEMSHSFLIFMALAMLIASAGIYLNEIILIVGAMVVGPEFGAIAGACVAIVNREPGLVRRSVTALAVGFPLGIAACVLMTLIFNAVGLIPQQFEFAQQSLTAFISDPGFFSVYVAFLAGIIGMMSLTSAKSGALVGVLISVTTIPAAANIGVALAYLDWPTVGGAAEQLVLNLAAIFTAGLLTLYIQRRIYMRRRRLHLGDGVRALAGLPIGTSRRAAVVQRAREARRAEAEERRRRHRRHPSKDG